MERPDREAHPIAVIPTYVPTNWPGGLADLPTVVDDAVLRQDLVERMAVPVGVLVDEDEHPDQLSGLSCYLRLKFGFEGEGSSWRSFGTQR